ncbi:DUF5681 domain-containing protein [Bradyrhizobium cytisi]|uniref:DUF5681 domain-containing protein n=1 Tax=Bradyrhizobium cytisi TaxID=515489 RepID=A0A5S4WL19_9BRAD|nr:DUF5681 domain-containing protein [Bradyrhizobium cytisi]TYL82228.1 hypothetical protein FXB38_21965 [Bradyrhizobium cytisi]
MGDDIKRHGRKRRKKSRPRKRRKPIVPPLSVAAHFRRLATEEIELEVNGKLVKMSRWDAYIKQLYRMALNKDTRASRLIRQVRKQFPGEVLPGEIIIYQLSEGDMRL